LNLEVKNILFSIVIPVYNVEDYLNQCVDSILIQNFTDFEVILVNDGSTDSSLDICINYKKKDNRIKVVNKTNGGLSDARNRGLSEATGEYIIFVDSDDFWIGNETLSDLALVLKKQSFDIILHEESRYFSKKKIECKNNQSRLEYSSGSFENHALDLVYNHIYVASAWNKIIKRALLIENNLFFPLNKVGEDMEWCAKMINHLQTYYVYPKSFYMYRQLRPGSLVFTLNEKACLDIYDSVKNGLQEADINKKSLQLAIKNYWSFYYVVLLMHYNKLTLNNKKQVIKDLHLWKNLITNGRNLTTNKVAFFYRFMPFSALIYFLDFYAKLNLLYKKNKI
jgi:glycosyltransferase involved in cell wall biosynthesis